MWVVSCTKCLFACAQVLYSDMDLQQQAARAPLDNDRVTYTTVNQPANPDQLNYADMVPQTRIATLLLCCILCALVCESVVAQEMCECYCCAIS